MFSVQIYLTTTEKTYQCFNPLNFIPVSSITILKQNVQYFLQGQFIFNFLRQKRNNGEVGRFPIVHCFSCPRRVRRPCGARAAGAFLTGTVFSGWQLAPAPIILGQHVPPIFYQMLAATSTLSDTHSSEKIPSYA